MINKLKPRQEFWLHHNSSGDFNYRCETGKPCLCVRMSGIKLPGNGNAKIDRKLEKNNKHFVCCNKFYPGNYRNTKKSFQLKVCGCSIERKWFGLLSSKVVNALIRSVHSFAHFIFVDECTTQFPFLCGWHLSNKSIKLMKSTVCQIDPTPGKN